MLKEAFNIMREAIMTVKEYKALFEDEGDDALSYRKAEIKRKQKAIAQIQAERRMEEEHKKAMEAVCDLDPPCPDFSKPCLLIVDGKCYEMFVSECAFNIPRFVKPYFEIRGTIDADI